VHIILKKEKGFIVSSTFYRIFQNIWCHQDFFYVLESHLLCSARLDLFHEKYSKNSNV